jgi:protein-S-isoprenylcysteine O-methyltransferase Ste14
VWVINLLLSVLILVPTNPELLAERSQVKEGADKWDILLAALMAYSFVFNVIVAGLDARFGWTAGFPLWVMLAGGVVALVGAVLTLWSMVANKFFSGVVRIQRERGHTVVSSGPYRYIRHPGYVGALVFMLAMPVMLGSWWAFVPAIITTCTSIYRTWREDRKLQQELDGYREYAQKVRYLLVPGIW